MKTFRVTKRDVDGYLSIVGGFSGLLRTLGPMLSMLGVAIPDEMVTMASAAMSDNVTTLRFVVDAGAYGSATVEIAP